MSIKIAGVDLFSQGLDNEYRISILERILDKILINNSSIKISKEEIEEVKKETLIFLQKNIPKLVLLVEGSDE